MNTSIFHDFFQLPTEWGFAFPFCKSRKECQNTWKMERNEQRGNAPIDYANKPKDIINYLVRRVKEFGKIPVNYSILEIGCNAGANLNGLYQAGYKNLYGIEINPAAIDQMKESFPDAYSHSKIVCGDALDSMKQIESKSIDVIFTMSVLFHIHPSQNALFGEMVRVAKHNILTIERETYISYLIFPRNYRRVFEGLGCTQIYERMVPWYDWGYERYTFRLFSGINEMMK